MKACADEADLLALMEQVRAGDAEPDALVDYLREDAPIHDGSSTTATARVRGWVLASFADVGLPERALPYVLEELDTGIEPLPVGGAARALRGGDSGRDVTEHLVRAFRNLRSRDEAISFDALAPAWPPVNESSALKEILATAMWAPPAPSRWREVLEESTWLEAEVRDALEAAARPRSCCGGAAATVEGDSGRASGSLAPLADAIVEDQDGRRMTLGSLTLGSPTILTFFYTRCENPNKCSLTIAKLGRLQRWLAERDRSRSVRILALTYDPDYDLPPRLRRYAQDRALEPDAATVIGRLPEDYGAVRDLLQLRVGRGGATVNRHAVEVFVIAPDGTVADVHERRDWDVATVGAAALVLRGGAA